MKPTSKLRTTWQAQGSRRHHLNRLIAKLTHKGRLSISVTLSISLITKLEIGYTAEFDKSKDAAA